MKVLVFDVAVCAGPASRALFPWFFARDGIPAVRYWERIKRHFLQNLLEGIQIHYASGFQACSGVIAKNLNKKYRIAEAGSGSGIRTARTRLPWGSKNPLGRAGDPPDCFRFKKTRSII